MREVLDYNSQLEQLAQQPGMPKGLAKTNVYGGKYSEGGQDMRELFRWVLNSCDDHDIPVTEQKALMMTVVSVGSPHGTCVCKALDVQPQTTCLRTISKGICLLQPAVLYLVPFGRCTCRYRSWPVPQYNSMQHQV